jgi:hypothetical protein
MTDIQYELWAWLKREADPNSQCAGETEYASYLISFSLIDLNVTNQEEMTLLQAIIGIFSPLGRSYLNNLPQIKLINRNNIISYFNLSPSQYECIDKLIDTVKLIYDIKTYNEVRIKDAINLY